MLICIIVLDEWYSGGDYIFNFDNNVPIYVQLVEQLKILIITGRYKSGEKIPSVRDLATEAKVNPNTMQKALTELEDVGLIFTERTNGKFVTDDLKLIENLKKEYASMIAKKYFERMKSIGYDREEAIKYLKGDK